MSKESDHAAQQAAQAQQAQISQQQLQLMQNASKPDALTERWRAMIGNNLNFFGVSDPANPGANKGWTPDYDLSRTNKDGTPVFQGGPVFANAATTLARAKREDDRTGTGAVGLGSYGADPGQLAQLRESRVRHASEDASLAAADAVDEARRETFGAILPLSGDRNQTFSTASGIGNNASQATSAWQSSIPTHQPWYQTALQIAGGAAPFFLRPGGDSSDIKKTKESGGTKTSTVWSGDRGSSSGGGVYA